MSKINIKPLGDKVLIEREQSPQSKGGILLPESAKEKPRQGKVIAIGPGKMDEDGNLTPMDLQINDHVLFSSYAGTEVQTDNPNIEYLLLSQEDILGILVTN